MAVAQLVRGHTFLPDLQCLPWRMNYSTGECAEGYAGATCANCVPSSHYMYQGKCKPCESLEGKALLWTPSVLVLVAMCLAATWAIIRWVRRGACNAPGDATTGRKAAKRSGFLSALGKCRHVLFVKGKIAISAYQIVKQASSAFTHHRKHASVSCRLLRTCCAMRVQSTDGLGL